MSPPLPPAVRAFERVAPRFDERFRPWLSVAAQRRAVRRTLLEVFPPRGRILELGAGTGEDALHLLDHDFSVTITDGAPAMLAEAERKVREAGHGARASVEPMVLEDIEGYASRHVAARRPPFDGAYSNFAAFNCIEEPSVTARPLASMLRTGAACVLVVFGPFCPGEIVVELLRGRPAAAMRRLRRGPAPARLGGEAFRVWYHAPGGLARALRPWFRLLRVRGVGVLVPPSAAEPWISSFPRLLAAMESGDRVLSAPLARLGDHVLLHFERTSASA